MGTRNRKIRKQRSSRTHGWGTKGQHRDGGMKGVGEAQVDLSIDGHIF